MVARGMWCRCGRKGSRRSSQQEEQPAGAASRSSRSSSRSRRKRGIGAGQRDGVATLPRLC